MSLPDSETLMKTVLEKYPDATDLKEDIDVHMEEFKAFEYRFKLTNVVLRALTLPIPKLEDESEVVFEGRSITYHWTFWTGDDEKKIVSWVNYSPKPIAIQTLKNKSSHRKKDITYSQYIDIKGTVEPGFVVPKNYFVPHPDPDLQPEDAVVHYQILTSMKDSIEDMPHLMSETKLDCEMYIKDRFEELLQEYQESKNTYYLARADFYRKLKFEHLDLDHQLLISAANRDWIDGYFLEKELRASYSLKIDSLAC